MTTPTILPVGFLGNATDYLKVKCSRDGDVFFNRTGVISIPSGQTTGTIIGLVPFQVGAAFSPGGLDIAIDGTLGTSTTLSIGVVYDDNVGNTNILALYAAATASTAAGPIATTESVANTQYVTTGNGWLVAVVGGATTTATANIAGIASVDYLNGGIQA